MHIVLANPRGFCAGVNMAIASLQTTLERFGSPIYVYHQIVHNRWVVDRFARQGVVFVDQIEDVPEGSLLLYSAHGVSPCIRKSAAARGLRTIDATCPLVTRVHRDAMRLAREGYTILLIGHKGHDEVVGTMGEAPEAMILIERGEEIDQVKVDNPDKVAYLTQTTLSIEEATKIVARLRERFPRIVGPTGSDVCYATQSRQEAVQRLASRANLVLVVGSQNSSNSRRLAELAQTRGMSSHLIDGPGDIQLDWFRGDETVVITAGASAPEDLVIGCVELLKSHFQATVEAIAASAEEVHFAMPRELRD